MLHIGTIQLWSDLRVSSSLQVLLCAGSARAAKVCTCLIHYRKRLEPLKPEDHQITKNTVVHDGLRLHQTVGQQLWCVTLEDLKQFRRLVLHAIAEGMIRPTDHDPFDLTDTRVGPSMYTVNTQYIMPITAAAGNPSWALMLHPEAPLHKVPVTAETIMIKLHK